MSISIDWISVSFPEMDNTNTTAERLDQLMPEFAPFNRGKSRAPFSIGYKGIGASFFMKPVGSLLEITGTGCQRIADDKPLLLWYLSQKITRIDICTDYEHKSPDDLCHSANVTGLWDTDSGKTFYLGSSKSDTMARIYRYNEPHPRAHLTRYEVVFRRKNAMRIAEAYVAGDTNAIWGTMLRFAKRRKVMLPDKPDRVPHIVMTPVTGDKDKAGTIRWLQKQVRPAIRRLINDGITDKEILRWLNLQ